MSASQNIRIRTYTPWCELCLKSLIIYPLSKLYCQTQTRACRRPAPHLHLDLHFCAEANYHQPHASLSGARPRQTDHATDPRIQPFKTCVPSTGLSARNGQNASKNHRETFQSSLSSLGSLPHTCHPTDFCRLAGRHQLPDV